MEVWGGGVSGVGGRELALCWSVAFLPPSFMSLACKLPASLNSISLLFVVEMLSDNYLPFGKHVAFLLSLEQKALQVSLIRNIADAHHGPIRKLEKRV